MFPRRTGHYKHYDASSMRGWTIVLLHGVLNYIELTIKELKTKEYETVWVIVSNNKVKIRIGLLYAPQETVDKSVIESMYNEIVDQRIEAEKRKEIFIVMGDLNCKIGEKIIGNKQTVSKYGNNLITLTKNINYKY